MTDAQTIVASPPRIVISRGKALRRLRSFTFGSQVVTILVACVGTCSSQRAEADQHAIPAARSAKTSGYPIFDRNSFWYQRMPPDAPLHPNSQAFAGEFARQVKTYYGHISINFEDYSSPLYSAGIEEAPIHVVKSDCWRSGKRVPQLEQDFAEVPVPPWAEPAGGSDSEMSIYQPETDTLWEFWKARKTETGWEACWGGRMSNVSGNIGIWRHPYGAAATGLPFASGQILADELARGEINHVLGIALVEAEEGVFSWPANRSDGKNPQKLPNRIPQGLRMRLDPTVNVDSLRLHPIARTIAKAAQIYGFVVWDVAGSVSLRAENPKRYTLRGLRSPYSALLGGTPGYKLMDGFPWDRMQFLPMDYGRP